MIAWAQLENQICSQACSSHLRLQNEQKDNISTSSSCIYFMALAMRVVTTTSSTTTEVAEALNAQVDMQFKLTVRK